MFPVEDPKLREQVIHIIQTQLEDNVKAHILQPDGTYAKIDKRGRKTLITAQDQFCSEAIAAAKAGAKEHDVKNTRVFTPAEAES
jgi:polyphosphate kinase